MAKSCSCKLVHDFLCSEIDVITVSDYMVHIFLQFQGGSKIQEAYLIFQDFSEKYQMTGMILNGKAVCCMHMGRFDEAESLLLEALNKVPCTVNFDYETSA